MFDNCYVRLGLGALAGCQPLTVELLASLYALRHREEGCLYTALAMMGEDKPWSASLLVAPEPTTAAVRPILRSAMLATRRLDPAELNLGALPGTSRARRHLAALRELWLAHPEVVPADLQNLRDFLGCEAGDPAVLSAVLAEVDCVIIDEFQDTSPIQFAFLWSLASQAPRTLIVGDTKQAVMGFQGADPASPPRSPASSRPRR